MQNLVQALEDKSILLTGGTGSFGQAFVQKVLTLGNPRRVIVFSRDEQKHHAMKETFNDPRIRFFVGDVRDLDRLKMALRSVDIVIHAAAMKHVDLCEYNPIEAIRTNVMGSVNIIQAALDAGVQQVVGVSTDKAVAPANLYGATKLCMEKLFTSANAYSGDQRTRFATVRYGNVMGSKGSVIPLFLRQKQAGKLTITDDRMTRFWVDMNGAIELVFKALKLMRGGEIFIPKLPSASVTDLAETLAPGVPLEVIGMRPGEKLHESLLAPEECPRTRDLGDLLVVEPDHVTWNREKIPGGKPVSKDFYYGSDRQDLRLKREEMSELVHRVVGVQEAS